MQPPIHAEIAGQPDKSERDWRNAPRPGRGLPTTTLCRLIEHAVDPARHDEIVLVQSLDLLWRLPGLLIGSKNRAERKTSQELCHAGRNWRMVSAKFQRKQKSFLELRTSECVPRTENRGRDHEKRHERHQPRRLRQDHTPLDATSSAHSLRDVRQFAGRCKRFNT